ncbi:MAG: cell division protein ZapA [Parvularcula sp.]|jgi:cell division protein ZapA|nr:cell division protein ZapA [Parvularcula sp.]
MAEVSVRVGDKHYVVACDDGGEARLQRLADSFDERLRQVERGQHGLGEAHGMLIAALGILDEYDEAQSRWLAMTPEGAAAEWAASRLDAVSARLEKALAARG